MNLTMRAVAITVSDRCAQGVQEDVSGRVLRELLRAAGAEIIAQVIVADDLEPLTQALRDYADGDSVNLIVTTGGTGLRPVITRPKPPAPLSPAKCRAWPRPCAPHLCQPLRWQCSRGLSAAHATVRLSSICQVHPKACANAFRLCSRFCDMPLTCSAEIRHISNPI